MLDPNMFSGNASTGEMPLSSVEDLRKALVAGQTYDIENLSGGQALRIQSLDKTMQAVIQDNPHFRLFNRLPKPNASATVDEWTEQTGVGGFLGGTTNTEVADIALANGTYTRRVGLVKYLMTRRHISYVLTLQNNIVDAEAQEYMNGALQLLTDAEFLCFEGDSDVVPSEFDGIAAQMADVPANILDFRAQPLASMHAITRAAAHIAGYGQFGIPTDLFLSQQAQADLDNSLDPAFRVPLPDIQNGGTSLGAPVVGIRTSWGNIATNPDIFIRDEHMMKPLVVTHTTMATTNVANKPISVATSTKASHADSVFTSAHAGWYYWGVAGVGVNGESDITWGDTRQNVAAGERVTITITDSAAAGETGYAIYRSAKAASDPGAPGNDEREEVRLMARVANDGATTTYYDNNLDIPGTTKAVILNMKPSATSITWRQLLPMVKFPLYPTASAIIPWAQLLFGYLRMSKRQHCVMFKNILPNSAEWRPFG